MSSAQQAPAANPCRRSRRRCRRPPSRRAHVSSATWLAPRIIARTTRMAAAICRRERHRRGGWPVHPRLSHTEQQPLPLLRQLRGRLASSPLNEFRGTELGTGSRVSTGDQLCALAEVGRASLVRRIATLWVWRIRAARNDVALPGSLLAFIVTGSFVALSRAPRERRTQWHQCSPRRVPTRRSPPTRGATPPSRSSFAQRCLRRH